MTDGISTGVTQEDVDTLLMKYPLPPYEVRCIIDRVDVIDQVEQPNPEKNGEVYLNWKIVDSETGVIIVAFAGGCSKQIAYEVCSGLNRGTSGSFDNNDIVRPSVSEIRQHIPNLHEKLKLLLELQNPTPTVLDLINRIRAVFSKDNPCDSENIGKDIFFLSIECNSVFSSTTD